MSTLRQGELRVLAMRTKALVTVLSAAVTRNEVRIFPAPQPPIATVRPNISSLTYIDGSSVKLEQVIGDCDWQHYDWADQKGTCVPTTSQTETRFNILGNDVSSSFEDNGKVKIFATGRILSQPGGHFIDTSLHAFGANVVMFGAGPNRVSDVYLAMTPAATFASGTGTQYFGGLVNGPAWPSDNPTIGNLSVVYTSDLGLWLMTYDGGRQSSVSLGSKAIL